MKRIFVAGLALAMLAGCSGGRKIVPVSGMVRLNGEPYPNAIVTFQPLSTEDDQNPGRGSAGKSGPDGRYTLVYDGEKPGAVTGRHRVRIATDTSAGAAKDDKSESDPTWRGRITEPIPIEWHDKSEKEFTVPDGGTDKADFNIETKAPPRK